MKKLIVSALMALSCGVLFAEDMYLCWMISESPTFSDGGTIDPSKYTAKITSNEQPYLNFYEREGDLIELGYSPSVGNVQGWDTLAFIAGSESASFVVELYNEAGTLAYTSETLSDIGAYISTMKGMARPAETYGFKIFTAVPEPTSGLLLLLGVAGLALRRKNKKA